MVKRERRADKMKIGMVSVTFIKQPIEEVFRIAKKAGIDGIEWSARGEHVINDENIDKIKQLSEQEKIEIFSLGSYCYMSDPSECIGVVEMAVRMTAPVIRIWAGKKSPQDCSKEEFAHIVENTRIMADYASKYNITLGFEYHRNSLTETAESAVSLITAIGRNNVKLYWQNSGRFSMEENLKNQRVITPYLAGIFHIQNDYGGKGNQLLEEISEDMEYYFKPFMRTEHKVLVEFVKGGLEENFYKDVEALRNVLFGTLPKATDTHVPRWNKNGEIEMQEIPSWWKGSTQDVIDTVNLVKKGSVELLCETPGKRPVYMVRYGEKNKLNRTANYSSAMGALNYRYYADKSDEDYVPTVVIIGAEHGGEFEGTVAVNNLIKNIETGTDYAGNENLELLATLEGINLLLIPCVNMDGRARIPLKTFVGQDSESFRYYSQGTWKDGTLAMHPWCKGVHPIKDVSGFLGGYFNDDGINIVHDNFFFPMAEETKALLKLADEYVPDISLHLHGGGCNKQQFYQFDYMPKGVKEKIRKLSELVREASEKVGIAEHYYEREVVGREDADVAPSFNIQSAWTAICGEAAIIYESNQGLLYEKGRRDWDQSYSFEEIYKHHRVLFETTFNYVKKLFEEK